MLDNFIDRMFKSFPPATGRDPRFGPFGTVGSLTNLALGGILLVFSVVAGITSSSAYFVLAVAALVVEIFFVRIAMRARRGDFTPK